LPHAMVTEQKNERKQETLFSSTLESDARGFNVVLTKIQNKMNFEYLANELILDLFEYLDANHLLHAFYGLNTRFNQLLLTKFRSYRLDFRSISKHDFETFCQQYLPSIVDRVISLHLSDSEETPNLPKIFLSHGFTINQFIHLQSLSLYYIQSFKTLNQLIIQCSHLSYLTHLNMIKCYFNYPDNDLQCLINNIWNLPRLTHCIFEQITSRKIRLTGITVISSTIKHLILEKVTCDFRDLSHLFEHTPCLQRISINLAYGFPNQQLQTPILSIISLKILFHGCTEMLTNLFENIPNLVHLTLETFDIFCDGYEWEKILVKYISNINVFRLKMNLNFPHHNNVNKQVDDLLDTFRTSFWLEEHRWFVRCDWDPSTIFSNGILYTLPYAFDDCFYFDAVTSKSTCPMNTDYWTYDRVQILSHGNPENDLAKDLILFSARFSNIRYLNISFPFNDNFWSCISSLDRLTSINVTLIQTDSAYDQLQELINRALHLYSFKVSYSTELPLKVFAITSTSIRRLDFITKSKSCIRYFNNVECIVLVHSPLVLRCEILLIGIKNRTDIIDLVNKIPNLRSLTCQCEDDEYNAWSTNDELVEWLRDHLPSTYSISRDKKRTYVIRLWIG
jgi:hypothetical protein